LWPFVGVQKFHGRPLPRKRFLNKNHYHLRPTGNPPRGYTRGLGGAGRAFWS
jgi:hypothetical protein